jgi:hypothetical protein
MQCRIPALKQQTLLWVHGDGFGSRYSETCVVKQLCAIDE